MLKFKNRPSAWFLSAIAAAVSLQSCGPNRLAADCKRLQNTISIDPYASSILVSDTLRSNASMDKIASLQASEQQVTLANQLAQLPLRNQTLSSYRNELTTLYRHDSGLGLQVIDFMNDAGEISVAGGSRTAYEQMAAQRIAIAQQVQDVSNLIVGYCATDEF